jgi:predicted kinase
MLFAAAYALPRVLVLTCGLPGTGKSSMAKNLSTILGAKILRSDVVRKRIEGLDPTTRCASPYEQGLYTTSRTQQTYVELLRLARAALEEKRNVIVDAAFLKEEQRRVFANLAREMGVRTVLIHLTCPQEEVERRLKARTLERREASDADFDVYLRAKEGFEAPERGSHQRVAYVSSLESTEASMAAVFDQLV